MAWVLDRLNVQVELASAEARAYLKLRGGEAVTLGDSEGATILFASPEPTASAVLEEVAHALQNHQQSWVDRDAREMQARREIEAKACLDQRADALDLPFEERQVTLAQLRAEQARLSQLLESGL